MSRFGKVLTAMVTPFTSSGDLDLDEAGRLAQWLIQMEMMDLLSQAQLGNRQHLLTMSKLH